MSGALKTLVTMLAAAPSLASASVLFGEENINAQDALFPIVVIVPTGGSWNDPTGSPGYYQEQGEDSDLNNSNVNNVWMTRESIDLYMTALANDPTSEPIDHADALETFRAQVLRALQDQAPNGLKFVPMSGRWVMDEKASIRMGRSYVLTVQVDITVTDVLPVDVTVEDVTLNPIAFT